MHYWETTEHARSIRARVFALMDERGIASTPVNYELWFAYELGQNRDLRRELDDVLANEQCNDAVIIKALHQRYFSRPDERVEDANNRLQTELTQLASALATVGEGAAEYGRVLGQAGDQLTRSVVSVDVKAIIDQAAGATTQMEQRNQVLEQQVESSTRELAVLRSQLAAVKEESLTDSLTGLANRRAFDLRITDAVAKVSDAWAPLCLLLCDIDRFKIFNDTWGHATGDQVLRLVGSVLKSTVGVEHFCARYGGEEMAVLLPNTTLADAITIGEQIRAAIEAKKVIKKSTGESLGQITISIGAAQFIARETMDDFVVRADRHLYMAKQLGRNRVCWVGKSAAGAAQVNADASDNSLTERETSLVELEFADQDTPLIVDALVTPTDERLVQVLSWWKAMARGGFVPAWRDDMLKQIEAVREHAHVFDVMDQNDDVRARYVGPALISALGVDPTGIRYSLDKPAVGHLRSTAERVFELLSLTLQMRAPLRAFSKSVRHLRGKRLSSEILLLPFSENGSEVSTILGVTLYSPAATTADNAVA
jgi:diguanylate cyclase